MTKAWSKFYNYAPREISHVSWVLNRLKLESSKSGWVCWFITYQMYTGISLPRAVKYLQVHFFSTLHAAHFPASLSGSPRSSFFLSDLCSVSMRTTVLQRKWIRKRCESATGRSTQSTTKKKAIIQHQQLFYHVTWSSFIWLSNVASKLKFSNFFCQVRNYFLMYNDIWEEQSVPDICL